MCGGGSPVLVRVVGILDLFEGALVSVLVTVRVRMADGHVPARIVED